MFVLSTFALAGGLAWFAMRINRQDRHSAIATALWLFAVVLGFWAWLLWLVGT